MENRTPRSRKALASPLNKGGKKPALGGRGHAGILGGKIRGQTPVVRCGGQPGGTLGTMSDADIAEILKLPAEERMRLLEIIWESLASDPSSIPVGDAHRAVLDERLADLQRNPDDVVSLDEVIANARRR